MQAAMIVKKADFTACPLSATRQFGKPLILSDTLRERE
jgi:hypothetical protein